MTEPINSGETFWMLLTVLSMNDKELLDAIGGVPKKEDRGVISQSGTNADNLLRTLEGYYLGWFDEVDERGAAKEIIEIIESGVLKFPTFQEELLNSEQWKKIRQLAQKALKDAKLDLWPIEGAINFYKYIELYD